MKTAEEITKELTRIYQQSEDDMRYLMYKEHPPEYGTKIDTIKHMRKWLLEFEYYPNKRIAMKGIEQALRWILEEPKQENNFEGLRLPVVYSRKLINTIDKFFEYDPPIRNDEMDVLLDVKSILEKQLI